MRMNDAAHMIYVHISEDLVHGLYDFMHSVVIGNAPLM